MPVRTRADSIEVVAEQFCLVCGCATRRIFAVRGYWIRGCTGCGHQAAEIRPARTHVETIYGDTYFKGGEAGYPDYLAESALLLARGHWYARLLERFTSPGRMLDVGTAAGFLLRGFQDRGWKVRGLEPNRQMATFGRQSLGLPIDCQAFEDFASSERYDLVTMVQVVAHLTNVRKAFQITSEILPHGAHLLIETWNRRSWTARIFGTSWHEYSPPSVLRWFSPEDLERLVGQFGFRRLAVGRPPKRIQGAHAKTLLRYKFQEWRLGGVFSPLTRLIPDRLEIPYPAEDLFWSLFEKG